MSLDFFRIERGLELDDTVQYLQGSGAPGAAGDTAAAQVGSVYTDNASGDMYTKIAAGTGLVKWQKMASETYVNNALGATISWREPAQVRDNVSTALPTGTATQPITIDGVSVGNGTRVLFSAITGGNGKNIYVYNQATGLFVEDTNAESNGDAVYVMAGTSAGKTYVFNGSDWVQSDQSSLDEEGYIRAYIGKPTAGNVLPAYTSVNFVTLSQNLTAAVSALDAEFGANVNLGNYVNPAFAANQNIQALDTAIGPNVTSGGFILASNKVQQNIQALDTHLGVQFAAGNFISLNQTVSGAVTALDAEIGPNVVAGNFIAPAVKVNQNIQALDSALGAGVVNGGYILAANSTNANVQALDAAVTDATKKVSVTNVTSVQNIDVLPLGTLAAKWFVRVVDAADPTAVYATEVYAVMSDDGVGGYDSDFTRYATLKLGAPLTGLVVSVDVASGQLRLRVAATGAVNVTSRRASVIA
jgi:hypothetical protein